MCCICYYYEVVQVLNDNVMFIQEILFCYEAIQVSKNNDVKQIHKNTD